MSDQNFQQQPQQSQYSQPQYSQQPQYPQQPQYHQQPQFQKGPSVAALVLGILGVVGAFIPGVKYVTLVLSILGIIFGVVGQKKAKEVGATSGLATAGLVCGIIGTAFSAVGVICALACASSVSSLCGLL